MLAVVYSSSNSNIHSACKQRVCFGFCCCSSATTTGHKSHILSLTKKNTLTHCFAVKTCSIVYLLRETWLGEREESVNVGRFKRYTGPNVFHGLITNSCEQIQITDQWCCQKVIPNVFGRVLWSLTLLFGFRWHRHVVELIHQPYTVRDKDTRVMSEHEKHNILKQFDISLQKCYLQVVHHGCGGAWSLRFIMQRNGLHQVIHGRTRNQGL